MSSAACFLVTYIQLCFYESSIKLRQVKVFGDSYTDDCRHDKHIPAYTNMKQVYPVLSCVFKWISQLLNNHNHQGYFQWLRELFKSKESSRIRSLICSFIQYEISTPLLYFGTKFSLVQSIYSVCKIDYVFVVVAKRTTELYEQL